MILNTKQVSVIIVNYNSTTYLKKLLKSLKLINKYINEIIVVDNHSINQNKLRFNNGLIKLIKNKTNLGFSKAVNIAIKSSSSKYLLLLNPDCLLIDSSIGRIVEKIDRNKKIGAIGGKLLDYNNKDIQFSATSIPTFFTGLFEFTNLKKIFPNNYWTKKFWVENINHKKSDIICGSVCGAFILFRRKIKSKLNLFSEDFFLYLEDVYFGKKINDMGYKVIFSPYSAIKHYKGASNESIYRIKLKYWYQSRKILFKKILPYYQYLILSLIFSMEEFILFIYHLIKNKPNE